MQSKYKILVFNSAAVYGTRYCILVPTEDRKFLPMTLFSFNLLVHTIVIVT